MSSFPSLILPPSNGCDGSSTFDATLPKSLKIRLQEINTWPSMVTRSSRLTGKGTRIEIAHSSIVSFGGYGVKLKT